MGGVRAKGPECSFYYKETYDIIALQKFFSPVTWAAAKELKWDPDGEQAWPGLTWHPRGGERVAQTPSAETVSVVPLSHIWNHHGSAVNWTWKQGFRCGVAHMVAVSLYRQALVPSCLQQCLLSPPPLSLSLWTAAMQGTHNPTDLKVWFDWIQVHSPAAQMQMALNTDTSSRWKYCATISTFPLAVSAH